MNVTKLILFSAFYGASLLAPATVIADTESTTFEADKDRYIANILERIQIDQKNLSCVQAAQDQTALKACDVPVKSDDNALVPKVEAPITDKKLQNTKNKHPK